MNNRIHARRLTAAGVALLFLLLPSTGQAQTPATSQGPLIVEVVHDPFVVATDYKVTDFDGKVGQLAGGYIGRAMDETLFIGAAGYWLVNGSDGDELAYGGLLTGWSVPLGTRIRFGARGLIGGGRATLGTDVDFLRGSGRFNRRGRAASLQNFRGLARDDFFVFEPQADLLTRVTNHVSLNWAAGYRLTAFADVLDNRLNGATGSVALQVEW